MKFTEYLRLNESAGTVQPKTLAELKQLVRDTIKEKGPDCDLNFIDTSKITAMAYLFEKSNFNGDISKWDVRNVTDMTWMFYQSKFNQDISKWDVRNVANMNYMFYDSDFNGDISKWNVLKVEDHISMFDGCPLEVYPQHQPKFND